MNMANSGTLSHNGALGSQVTQGWTKLGENVGMGGSTAQIFEALAASAPHLRNMSDPAFSRVGVGTTSDAGGRLWTTHVFLQPSAGRTAPAPTPARPAVTAARAPSPKPAPATTAAPKAPAPTPAPTVPATTTVAPPATTVPAELVAAAAEPAAPSAAPGPVPSLPAAPVVSSRSGSPVTGPLSAGALLTLGGAGLTLGGAGLLRRRTTRTGGVGGAR